MGEVACKKNSQGISLAVPLSEGDEELKIGNPGHVSLIINESLRTSWLLFWLYDTYNVCVGGKFEVRVHDNVCPLDEQDVLGVFRPEAQNTAIIISKKAFDATSRNEETKGTQPSFSSLSNAMEEDKEVRPRSAAAYIPHSARAGYFLQEGGNPLPEIPCRDREEREERRRICRALPEGLPRYSLDTIGRAKVQIGK